MRMQWRHLLFMHWPIPVEKIRPLVPRADRLQIETFEGVAWVGLIPFTMRCVQPWVIPPLPGVGDVRSLTAFHECNVRTYVECDGVPGVWFFSLDAASQLAVWGARKFFHLPYFYARMRLTRREDEIEYAVNRMDNPPEASLRCRWRVGIPLPPSKPGDLAHFLTERYGLYSVDPHGGLYRGRIRHKPWPLRAAELISLDASLVRAAGIEIDHRKPPALHHADVLNVQAWGLERA